MGSNPETTVNAPRKVWVCVGTPDERKKDATLVPNYRMIRSSVQTLHYLIVDPSDPKADPKTGIVDYVVDPGKHLIKGKDPKKRNIYRFSSNVAEPNLTKTDPKAYSDPLHPDRVAAFTSNVAKFAEMVRDYDTCTHISKDGREVKRIVTIGAEADGKTPLDLIALMELGILEAIKLRGQKQCTRRNRPKAIETLARELGQTLAPKSAKAPKDEEADEDWEPDVTDIDEEVA